MPKKNIAMVVDTIGQGQITPVKIMLWHVLLGVSSRECKSSKSVVPLTVRLVCQKEREVDVNENCILKKV